jgi:hypothetical protein
MESIPQPQLNVNDDKSLPPFLPLKAGQNFTEEESKAITIRKVQKRGDNHLQLGFTLLEGAIEANDVPSMVDADLLIESGTPESGNLVMFENLRDKQNRAYRAVNQLVSLPTRLDSGSQRKRAYPNRKRIIKQFEREDVRQKIADRKLFPYFITPTYTNLIGRNFEESLGFLEEVAKQFRDSAYYEKVFKGAHRKTDFTSGKKLERWRLNRPFDYRVDGYNFHNHYAIVSSIEFEDTSNDCEPKCNGESCKGKHIYNRFACPNKKLAKAYTDIVKKVHLEIFGYPMDVPESDLFRVDIRPIDLTTNGDERKGIAFEMAKYLTHSQAFLELEPSELVSANRILKGKKLVNSTGIFNNKRGRIKASKAKKRNNLEVSEKSETVNKSDATLLNLPSSIFEKNLSSICKKIAGLSEITPEINREILSSIYEIRHEISLKEIGVRLCLSGNRQIWLNILPDLFSREVNKARNRFLSRFPNAVITDLQGNLFGEHRRNYTEQELERNLISETRHVFGNPKTLH